jgi:hypothetical protein
MEYVKRQPHQRCYPTPPRRKRFPFPLVSYFLFVIDVGFSGVFFFDPTKTEEVFS